MGARIKLDYFKYNRIQGYQKCAEWMLCKNKELLDKLMHIQCLYGAICERVLRCPHCGGHYVYESGSYEEGYDGFWFCISNDNEHYATRAREKMIQDLVGADEYWDYELYRSLEDFKGDYFDEETHTFKSKREFSVEEYNKEHPEKHWEQLVEETIQAYLEGMTKVIDRARKYPLLKEIFKKENFQ